MAFDIESKQGHKILRLS